MVITSQQDESRIKEHTKMENRKKTATRIRCPVASSGVLDVLGEGESLSTHSPYNTKDENPTSTDIMA